MKNSLERSFLLAGVLVLAQPLAGPAQDYFRDFGTSRSSGGIGPVIPSEYTYQDGSPSGLRALRPGQELSTVEQTEESEKYNFAVGPFRFSFAAGLGLEYNDNIRLSENNRESDFVLRPTIDLDARWRLSELNTLRFNIQASYAKYLDHSDLDTNGLLLSPNSELALTFFVGTIEFTVRDRFSYQEDPSDVPTLSNEAIYKRWENQAGIGMNWQVNQQFGLGLGYDHYNLWAQGEQFEEQTRSIDTVFIRPNLQLTPTVKVGLNAAYSFVNFSESDRSNANNIMAGPFVEWQISEYTNLYVEAGYQKLSYDGSNNYGSEIGLTVEEAASVGDVLVDESDANSWYARFELQNKPSDYFRHRLSGSKTSEIGFDSNSYELYHLEYEAEWQINGKTSLGPVIFYEYYTTSGQDSEDANRYGAAFGIRHQLSDSITLGLDYRFLLKDSNLPEQSYRQNLAFLSIYYKF